MDALGTCVVRAQAGDLDAYGTIVRRLQDMAVGYAYSILGDFHLAEDATQEAFVEAYLDLSKLRKPAVFPSWFRKTVFKHCDRLTRRRRIPTVSLEAAAEVAAPQSRPDEAAEAGEMRDTVLAALGALPEAERSVTALFYINGYSQTEIGVFLEVPVSTVKNRLRTARNRMRERMVGMVKENLHEQRPSRDETFADGVMGDLVRLTDREIQLILREMGVYSVSLRDLAVALKGGTEELRERIFQNMSKRLRMMVEDEMAFSGRVAQSDVRAVQSDILRAAQKLHQAGEVTWPPPEAPSEGEPKRQSAFEPSADYLAKQRELEEKLGRTPVSQLSYDEITEVIRNYAERARREGILLAFKEIVEVVCDEVLWQHIQLVTDGVGPGRRKAILGPQTQTMLQHYRTRYRMIFEGVMGIQGGDHPRVIERKLRMFYVPTRRERASYTEASVDDLEARLRETPFSKLGLDEVAAVLTDMSIVARKEGIAALEKVVERVDEKLLAQGLTLAIEGTEREAIENILERRMQTLLHRHEIQYGMIQEGLTAIQCAEHPRVIEQKVRSFYE